jgi:hypothetical protein
MKQLTRDQLQSRKEEAVRFIRIDAVPANVPNAWLREKTTPPAMCGFQKSGFRSDAIRRR